MFDRFVRQLVVERNALLEALKREHVPACILTPSVCSTCRLIARIEGPGTPPGNRGEG